MRAIELFAGAGGLALGVSRAGFDHEAVVEWDTDTCRTIEENKGRGLNPVAHWHLIHADVRAVDFRNFQPEPHLIAGGPPCQPFSICGKHKGFDDARNMFPEAVRSVRELAPRSFVFENVKGLTRPKFADYFEYIRLQLSYPEVVGGDEEDWREHKARLERHHTAGNARGLNYRVLVSLLNAADFGAPQKRERVFIVGFRSDLNVEWSFPEPTHSQESLLHAKWVTGDYWRRHGIRDRDIPPMPPRIANQVARLQDVLLVDRNPWLTVRDAIRDLPDPERSSLSVCFANHVHNPGARSYTGHTGSQLDEPAKTLKAGDHGVPGGENMVVYPDGRLRYFTVRESARLQGFPDSYVFPRDVSWTESMRQLGNAVPVHLGTAVATSVARVLRAAL